VRRVARPAHLTGPPAGSRLLGPADVRALAAGLRLRPSKQRGQNFVVDPNTVRRIARVADLRADDVVLEVGPGLGSLTLALLDATGRQGRVVAVEIDPGLCAALAGTVRDRAPGSADRLTVVQADAMRVQDLPGPPPTALVANLPYNVAVPVLLHLWALLPTVQRALVLVQAEVADRLVAAPGSRTYGVPSVKAAWYGTATAAGRVARTVFWPAPHVDSGLVAWRRHDPPRSSAARREVFAVVDTAFAQRRKTLRSALAAHAGSPAAAERALRAAGVDPGARGEQLGVDDFVRVATALGAEQ
jgi:16S rRNA (adenine1518-N6/adenine1519-N6)-dimethyltransferase